MSSITLFTDSRLPCPRRVNLVIAELGLTTKETRELDVFKQGQKTPQLQRLNPSAAVPFIQDETFDPPLVLSESRAIARYLVRQYGPKTPDSLVPDADDTRAWAVFEEAASIEQTAFDAAANPLVFEECFKSKYLGREADDEKAKALRNRLSHTLDILETRLSKNKFMAGNKMTLVDLFYLPYTHHLKKDVWPSLFDERPHLAAWWVAMEARPSYAAVFGSG